MVTAPVPAPSATVARPRSRSVPVVGLVVAVVALVVNGALFLLVSGGEPILATPPGAAGALPVTLGSVLLATAVATAVGTAALAVLGRARPRRRAALASAGLAVGVLSAPVPVLSAADAGDGVALAAMHVLTGLVWWLAVRRGPGGAS